MLGQLLGLLSHSVVMAQTAASSVDKFPTIEYDPAETSVNDPFTFVAVVTDDASVASVVLQYRFSEESEFRGIVMRVAPDGRTYTARLPSVERREGIVKYFFVANDDQGNAQTSDFPFDPASRTITAADALAAANVSGSDASASEPGKTSRKFKPLYVLLGVLAVGAIVGVAGGSTSGSSSTDCATEGCTISLVLPPPSN